MSVPANTSTVYGPVKSWRVGNSLGIDPILKRSTCSFNCIYCQLGSIQRVTLQRQAFVTTEQVVEDFAASDWTSADVITYSGSGEPTLATNLGEMIMAIRGISPTPQVVLTNGTLLHHEEVVRDLALADEVSVKLDAASDEMLKKVNRPAAGVSIKQILRDIKQFRRTYAGKLAAQVMLMPSNIKEINELVDVVADIGFDEIQLNTPTRPYPTRWHVSARGGHSPLQRHYRSTPLKKIPQETAVEAERLFRERCKKPVRSVYQSGSAGQ